MEKYFGNAYRGDLGVPHTDPERFVNIWMGSAAFSVMTMVNPYLWQLSSQFNWHDKAMLFGSITGKRRLKIGNLTNSSGINTMTKRPETPTTSTGQHSFRSCETLDSGFCCASRIAPANALHNFWLLLLTLPSASIFFNLIA